MNIDFSTNKKYIAVIDFEATCSNDRTFPRDQMEIIEFACVVIDKQLTEIDRFATFVRPVRNSRLTKFCTELTSISQEQVDGAPEFEEVISQFNKQIIDKYDPLFTSWGRYDKSQLQMDCKYHKVNFPFNEEHLDIKRWLPQYLGFNKPKGIGGMIRYLGMQFEGTPHRGIDDVLNIIKILQKVEDNLPKSEKI